MPKELSLPKRYLYGSTKRTSKADRAARIANARAALDGVGTSSGCLDGTGNKENMPNPLKDRHGISYLETALDASEQERERQMGLKRKLHDKHQYRENDTAKKRQKLSSPCSLFIMHTGVASSTCYKVSFSFSCVGHIIICTWRCAARDAAWLSAFPAGSAFICSCLQTFCIGLRSSGIKFSPIAYSASS
jgi:hypothetical protein